MPRILFIVSGALGHAGRASLVADALPADVDVTFAAIEGSGPDLVRGVGGYRPIPDGDRKSPEFADSIEQLIAAVDPDLVCIDVNPLHLALVRLPDIPVVLLTNWFLTHLGGDVETWQTDRLRAFPELNDRRVARGLTPIGDAKSLYLADDVVLCDPAGLVPAGVPEPFTVAGPVVWEPAATWTGTIEGGHLVASFGSTGKQRPAAAAVATFRAALGCPTAVWVGGVPGGEPGVGDLEVHNVALSSVCAGARLALTQGGAGSTYAALAAGVPVAVEPSHRNHAILADLLHEAGVGIRVETLARLDAEAIDTEVGRMAERLGELQLTDGREPAQRAAEVIMRRLAAGRGRRVLDLAEADPEVAILRPAATVAQVELGPLERWDDAALVTEVRRVVAPGGTIRATGSSPESATRTVPGFGAPRPRPVYRRRFARLPGPVRTVIGRLVSDAIKAVDLEFTAVAPEPDTNERLAPPRRLIVHVGTHKTGTTSLQHYLARNKRAFRPLGIDYHHDEEMGAVNAAALALVVVRHDLDLTLRWMHRFMMLSEAQADLRRRLRRAIRRPTPTMLMSHEAMSFVRTPEEARSLREIAEDREVSIVVVRRPRAEFLRSYRAQIAKNPEIPDPPYASSVRYVGDDTWILDVDDMVDVYADEFGRENVTVIDYDDAMRTFGSTIPAVMAACGVAPARLPAGWDERRNVSAERPGR